MARAKTVFHCGQCGFESAKWLGRCPDCGAWNSLIEEAVRPEAAGSHKGRVFRLPEGEAREASHEISKPILLSEVTTEATQRLLSGISELDRVLGGGLVPGSLILVGGDPGIGKSTLLLQALDRLAQGERPALYVTGEESREQVKLRAERLGVAGDRLLLLAETRADRIADAIENARPSAVVIDSIQTVFDPEISSAPGSVSQIREVAARFLYQAKSLHVPTFLVGHVTKHGELAGPRVLEHMVDTVLYFEQSSGHPYRVLRAHKNRFGSTNEIGVFEMRSGGLEVVNNPSELFLAERPEGAPGSVVLPAIEGSRPVLVEVQALVSPTSFGTPRRTCLGFDSARAALLAAVLERRAAVELLGCDIFVNIAGGMTIDDPAADLAVAVALASSLRNRPLKRRAVVLGEVGLAGEVRAIVQPEPRLVEAAKLGFELAIIPEASKRRLDRGVGIEVAGVRQLSEALSIALE
ncbi:MAG: DNA repair protein RadA [Deltaproteobacteria bacterium]|nr:DNA repair protein RadA [Deltaproteobacteria bacterium]